MTKKTAAAASTSGDQAEFGFCDFRALRGFDETRAKLRRLAARHVLPQALLLVGREGTGKKMMAAFTAALSCCAHGACGNCVPCGEVINGTHGDVLYVLPNKDEGTREAIRIADIGRVQEFLGRHSIRAVAGAAQTRVAVMIDADLMTEQAANRLLKTLEEPAEGSRIILTTSRPNALLPTVRSRMVTWHLAPPSADVVVEVLKAKGVDLISSLSAQALSDLVERAGHAPGMALRLAQDYASGRTAKVDEALGRLLRSDQSGEGDASVSLRIAEELTKTLQVGLGELVQQSEWLLGRFYREKIAHAGDATGGVQNVPGKTASTGAWEKLCERREHLRLVRRLAGRNGILLNGQLTVEGLFSGRP